MILSITISSLKRYNLKAYFHIILDKDEENDPDAMSMEAVLAPPQSSGEHEAYIPIDMAKQCIQKVGFFKCLNSL